MDNIRITNKGHQLIAEADKQGGIYPNNVYMLSAMRQGNWHRAEELRGKLQLADWDECSQWLLRNGCIEEMPNTRIK